MTAIRGGATVGKLKKVLSAQKKEHQLELLNSNNEDVYYVLTACYSLSKETVIIKATVSKADVPVDKLSRALAVMIDKVPVKIALDGSDEVHEITGYSKIDSTVFLEFKK